MHDNLTITDATLIRCTLIDTFKGTQVCKFVLRELVKYHTQATHYHCSAPLNSCRSTLNTLCVLFHLHKHSTGV